LIRKQDEALEKRNETVLAGIWHQLLNERLVVHEAAQAIFIGNESLLSNLTVLIHHMILNPECMARLRTELDTLDIGLFGHCVWRDPKLMQLEYLASRA
jgi:hypothetical protein